MSLLELLFNLGIALVFLYLGFLLGYNWHERKMLKLRESVKKIKKLKDQYPITFGEGVKSEHEGKYVAGADPVTENPPVQIFKEFIPKSLTHEEEFSFYKFCRNWIWDNYQSQLVSDIPACFDIYTDKNLIKNENESWCLVSSLVELKKQVPEGETFIDWLVNLSPQEAIEALDICIEFMDIENRMK